jgi:CheY-like chemotaxis protein
MNILLVEDNHFQADLITEKIRERFPMAEIERVRTESGFRSILDRLAARPPKIVIMDVMLRWADAGRDMPEAPADVEREGFYRAGLRCQKLLANQKQTAHLPVILYTVLESIDLKSELEEIPQEHSVTYLRKQSDVVPLLDQIYCAELRRED